MENKDARIYIRIDQTTKTKIEEKAKKENRSISNYLINLALNDINKDKKLLNN